MYKWNLTRSDLLPKENTPVFVTLGTDEFYVDGHNTDVAFYSNGCWYCFWDKSFDDINDPVASFSEIYLDVVAWMYIPKPTHDGRFCGMNIDISFYRYIYELSFLHATRDVFEDMFYQIIMGIDNSEIRAVFLLLIDVLFDHNDLSNKFALVDMFDDVKDNPVIWLREYVDEIIFVGPDEVWYLIAKSLKDNLLYNKVVNYFGAKEV